MRFVDLSGKTFGRLLVHNLSAKIDKRTRWVCICECGLESIVQAGNLASGHTTSCGCAHSEMLARRNMRHGLRHIPEYAVWCTMKARCTNSNHTGYHNYGGRGIRVCSRWSSFVAFIEDMGRRPSSRHTIERTDNDLNYSPDNCVWATMKEQCANRRPRKNK